MSNAYSLNTSNYILSTCEHQKSNMLLILINKLCSGNFRQNFELPNNCYSTIPDYHGGL